VEPVRPRRLSVPEIAVETYDLRGLNCPLPVLRTRKRLQAMSPGQRLWVETTDPISVIDIPAFCAEDGHLLVESVATETGHRFLIERG
jgi:tRNA 2-thiouridine synthesizing protein A